MREPEGESGGDGKENYGCLHRVVVLVKVKYK
jgi:hypothetical protein